MRLQPLQPEKTTGRTRELLDKVRAKMGAVPNIFKVMANAPAALDAYLAFSGAVATSTLPPPLREKIALAVAEVNRCDYCLAAHQAIGKRTGLSDHDVVESRRGKAADPKEEAALKLALELVNTKGLPSEGVLSSARKAGLSDEEMLEVTAVTVLNIYTNYINHVGGTEVDFPKAEQLSGK
ncbi:MAG: carboxymuconolactone decarboxylase family protein [Candidatus Omnitrophota bacterium]